MLTRKNHRNSNPTTTLLSCIVLCLFLLHTLQCTAQAQVQPRGGVNLLVGVPVAEFADNVDNLGFGIGLNGGIALAPAPIMIGIDLGYLIYGYERRSEPFSTTIPDVTVDVETTNSIALGHIFLRIQPQTGPIQPYAEMLFGFKYLFTRTSVENRASDQSIAASVNIDDFASSYGIGGGVDFRIFQGESDNGRPYNILINLGARYLLGSSAEYLERGSINRDDGALAFDINKSRTDLIIPQLGATFSF